LRGPPQKILKSRCSEILFQANPDARGVGDCTFVAERGISKSTEGILAPMRTEKVTEILCERTEGLAMSQPLDVKMTEGDRC
jgi:hypothetical protein